MTHGIDLIDIGSNLTHESFAADRAAVISAARRPAGVTRQIVTGADLESSRAAAALAERAPGSLWSTAGVHPHHAAGLRCRRAPRSCASCSPHPAGRRGRRVRPRLFPGSSPPAAGSASAFAAQLELAAAVGKPVFLHQRDAHEDFKAILADFRRALWRAESRIASPAARRELEAYLALGLSIGVTGWVCDERRGARTARGGAAHSRGPVDARDRRALSAAPGSRPRPSLAPQRAEIPARTSPARSPRCAANRCESLAACDHAQCRRASSALTRDPARDS